MEIFKENGYFYNTTINRDAQNRSVFLILFTHVYPSPLEPQLSVFSQKNERKNE